MGKIISIKSRVGEKIMEDRVGLNTVVEQPMLDIDTVADYFLSRKSMSPKKLQKMCYYAYSWYLTMFNQILFDDGKFEAWVHGPVNRKLYNEYKDYGWSDIKMKNTPQNLNGEITNFLNTILDTFSSYSADDLELMTHQEEPWVRARKGINPSTPSNEILNDDIIRQYYSSLRERAQFE